MTALYFADLRAEDRVSVKPHASPVLHAIEYLLGRLPRRYLTTLRDFRLTSWRYLHHQEKLVPRTLRKLAIASGFMVYEGLR